MAHNPAKIIKRYCQILRGNLLSKSKVQINMPKNITYPHDNNFEYFNIVSITLFLIAIKFNSQFEYANKYLYISAASITSYTTTYRANIIEPGKIHHPTNSRINLIFSTRLHHVQIMIQMSNISNPQHFCLIQAMAAAIIHKLSVPTSAGTPHSIKFKQLFQIVSTAKRTKQIPKGIISQYNVF